MVCAVSSNLDWVNVSAVPVFFPTQCPITTAAVENVVTVDFQFVGEGALFASEFDYNGLAVSLMVQRINAPVMVVAYRRRIFFRSPYPRRKKRAISSFSFSGSSLFGGIFSLSTGPVL